MSEALEKLLQSPRLWRGPGRGSGWQGLPSGYPRLDRQLPGGGWPPQALTEILLEHHGLGELELLMPALARLSQTDPGQSAEGASRATAPGWIAWVAPPFEPYPPALLQWGINLSRVLVVRPGKPADVLWAAEQALGSGNCAAVLLWPRAMDDAGSRRLQLAAEKGASWAIAFRSVTASSQPSAAALRIRVSAGGSGTDLEILKCRGGRPSVIRNCTGY